MKASLNLQVGQQLTMTPQLQQAIRLLQLSSMELQQEIQLALESNPLLELDDDPYDDNASLQKELLTGDEDSIHEDQDDWVEQDLEDSSQADPEQHDIPEQLKNDAEWQDIYPTTYSSPSTTSNTNEDSRPFESLHSKETSLEQHLLGQLNLLPLTQRDQVIGYCLISSLDDDGLLRDSLVDIGLQCAGILQAPFGAYETPEETNQEHDPNTLTLEEIEAVLHLIQRLDPPGVATTSLSECIERQLEQLPADTHGRAAARALCDFGLASITELPLPPATQSHSADSERAH